MTLFRTASLTSVFALSLSPVLAATPDGVWSNWQALIEDSYDATLEFSRVERSGENLTVSDLTIGSDLDLGDEIGSARLELVIDRLAFENVGNGIVQIGMTRTIPMTLAITDETEGDVQASMSLAFADETLRASGRGDDIRYDFDYPVLSVGQFEFSVEDTKDADPLPDLRLALDMAGFAGFVAFSGADVRAYDTSATLDTLAMDLGFDFGDGFTAKFNATDISQQGTGTIGSLSPTASMSELIASGTTQIGTSTYGPTTYAVTLGGPDGTLEIAAAAESGRLSSSMTADGLTYDSSTRNVTMSLAGDLLPLPPTTFKASEMASLFDIPVVPGPDAQDFELKINLAGLAVDETLWSLFDPTGALPRDPANLTLDLTGTGILSEDVTDPEFGMETSDFPPGELSSLSINNILLSLGGAELSGEGDFTFTTEGGIPMPAGDATIGLTGGLALLNTLVELGLLPQEQAMGAQMMLGLFAQPVGDDALRTEIEVTEDGQVLANGQRIR